MVLRKEQASCRGVSALTRLAPVTACTTRSRRVLYKSIRREFCVARPSLSRTADGLSLEEVP